MNEPEERLWITYEQAIAIHSRQLRRFGGAPGLRDEGMLRSALARPINKWRYEKSDMAELAAAYAFGLAKNHAFVDGNKRIAFMAMMGFLLNEWCCFRPGTRTIDSHHPRSRGGRSQRGKPDPLDQGQLAARMPASSGVRPVQSGASPLPSRRDCGNSTARCEH